MIRTISIFMISFLFTLLLVPVIVQVSSNNNFAVFAELGDCPSFYTWEEYRDTFYYTCTIACLEYPEEQYYFYAQIVHYDGDQPHYSWVYVLMILEGLNRCENPCHEYTACLKLPWGGGWVFTQRTAIRDTDNPDDDPTPENSVIIIDQWTGPPEWL